MPQEQAKRRGKKKIGTTSSIYHSSTRQGTSYSIPVVLALPETSGSPIQVSEVTQKTGPKTPNSGDQGSAASTPGDSRVRTRKSARLSLSTTPVVPNKKSVKRTQKLHHQKPASFPSKRIKLSQNESIPDESEQYILVGQVPESNHLETRLDKGDSDVVNLSRLQDEIHNTPNLQSFSVSPQHTKSRKAEITEPLDHVTKSKARTNPAVLSSSEKSISPAKLVSEENCLKTLRTSHDEAQSKRVLRTKGSLLNEKAVDVTEKESPIVECEDNGNLMGKGNNEPSPTTRGLKTRVKSTNKNATKFSSVDAAKSSKRSDIAKPTTKAGTSKSSARSSTKILSAEADNVESATKSAIVETDVAKPSTPKGKHTKYITRSHTSIFTAKADHGKTTTKSDASEEAKNDDTVKSLSTRTNVAEYTATTGTADLTVAEKNSVKFASLKTDAVKSIERSDTAKFSSRSKSGKSSTAESDVKHITRAVTAKSSLTKVGTAKFTAVENAVEICTKADDVKSTPAEVDTAKSLVGESDIKYGTRADQAKSISARANTAEVQTRESDVNSIGTGVHLKSASKNTIAKRSIAGSVTTKADTGKSMLPKCDTTESATATAKSTKAQSTTAKSITTGASTAKFCLAKTDSVKAITSSTSAQINTTESRTTIANTANSITTDTDTPKNVTARTDVTKFTADETSSKKCIISRDGTPRSTMVNINNSKSTIKGAYTANNLIQTYTEKFKESDFVKSSKSKVDATGSSTLETVNTEADVTECTMKSGVTESIVTETDEESTGSRNETEESLREAIGTTDSVAGSEIIKCIPTEASCTKSATRSETAKSSTMYPNFAIHIGPKNDADTVTMTKTDITEADSVKSIIAKAVVAKCFTTDSDTIMVRKADTMETTIKSDSVTFPENNANVVKTTAIETEIAKSSKGEAEAVNLNPKADIAKSFLVIDTERHTHSKSEMEKSPIVSTNDVITSPVKQAEITKSTSSRAGAKKSTTSVETIEVSRVKTDFTKPPVAIYSAIKTDNTEADAGKSITAKPGSTKWFSAEADITKATPTRTDAQSSVKADITKASEGKDARFPQIRVNTAKSKSPIVDAKTTKSSTAETEAGKPTTTAEVVKSLLVLDDARYRSKVETEESITLPYDNTVKSSSSKAIITQSATAEKSTERSVLKGAGTGESSTVEISITKSTKPKFETTKSARSKADITGVDLVKSIVATADTTKCFATDSDSTVDDTTIFRAVGTMKTIINTDSVKSLQTRAHAVKLTTSATDVGQSSKAEKEAVKHTTKQGVTKSFSVEDIGRFMRLKSKTEKSTVSDNEIPESSAEHAEITKSPSSRAAVEKLAIHSDTTKLSRAKTEITKTATPETTTCSAVTKADNNEANAGKSITPKLDSTKCSSSGTDFAKATPPKTVGESTTNTDLSKATTETDIVNSPHTRVETAKSSLVDIKTNKSSAAETEAAKPTTRAVAKSLLVVDPTRLRSQVEMVKSTTILNDEIVKLPMKKSFTEKSSSLAERNTERSAMKGVGTAESFTVEMDIIKPTKPKFETMNSANTKPEITEAESVKSIVATADTGKCFATDVGTTVDTGTFRKMDKMKTTVETDSVKSQTRANVAKSTTVETETARSGKVDTETIKLNRGADTEKTFLEVDTGRHTRSKSKVEKSSTVYNYDISKSSAEQTKDTKSPSTHSETSKLSRVKTEFTKPATPETAIYSSSMKTDNAKADAGKSVTAKSRNTKSSSPEADFAKAIQIGTDAESNGKADIKATTATSNVKSPQIRFDKAKISTVDTTTIKSSAVDTKATKSTTRAEFADSFSVVDGAKPKSKAEIKSATVTDADFVKSPVEKAYDVKSSSSKVIIAKSTTAERDTGRSVMKRVGTPKSSTEETVLTKPTIPKFEATNSVETKTDNTETCFAESITKSGTAKSTAEEIDFLKSTTAIVDTTKSKTKDSNCGQFISATTDSSVTITEELDLSESAATVNHIADALTVNIVAQCTEQEAGSVECTSTRTKFVKPTPIDDAKSFLIDTDIKDIALGTDAKKSSITEPESTVLNTGPDISKSSKARAETEDCTVAEADTTKSSSTRADTAELVETLHNTDNFITRSNIAQSSTAAVDSANSTTVKSDSEKLTKMNSDVKADTLSSFINKSDIEKSNVAKDSASESLKKANTAKSPRVTNALIFMTGVDIEKSFSLEKDDLKILSISDVEKSSSTAEVDIAITPTKTGVQSSSSEGEIAKVYVKSIPTANANTSELVSCIARDSTEVKFPGSNTGITPVSVTNGETVVTAANDKMTSVTIADIEMTSVTTSSTGCTSVTELVAGITTANIEDTVVSPATLGMTSDITTDTTMMPTTTANTGMIIMPTNNAKMPEVTAADTRLKSVIKTNTGMTSVTTADDKITSLKTASTGMKSFATSGIGETPTTQLSTGEIIFTTASTGERAVTTTCIRETMVTTANRERGVTTASNGKTSAITTSTNKLTVTAARNRNDIVSTAVTGKAKANTESSENIHVTTASTGKIQVTTASSGKLAKTGGSLKTTVTTARTGKTAITTARIGKTAVTTGNTRKTVSTTASTRETLATTASITKTVATTASTIKTVATTESTGKTTVIKGNTGKTKVTSASTCKTTVTTASARKTAITTERTGKTGGSTVKADTAKPLQCKTANSKQEQITPVDTESSANAGALTTTTTVDPLPKTGNGQVIVAKSCSKVKSPIKAPVVSKPKSEASTGKSMYSGSKNSIISKVNPAPATRVHDSATFAVATSVSGVVPDSSATSSTKVDTALINQKILNQLEEKSDHWNLNKRSIDEPLFDHVVIFANALYKHHLEKLSCYQVTVITEDNLSFKDVPEVISRSWNKRTKKALWLLPLGIYSHVEFHPNYDCERYRCLCQLTSISYEGNTEPSKEDMVYRISDMISQAKLLRESVQQELGPKSLVMLVPLMPAAVVEEDAFQDHHALHSAISKNCTYSSNSADLCVLHTIYNNLCNYWSSVVSEPMENYLSSVMVKFMNMNQGKNFTCIQSDNSYSFVFKPWLNMMKSVITLALTYCPKGTSGHPRNVKDLIPNHTVPSSCAVPVNLTQQIIGSSFKEVGQNQARPLFQQIVVLGNRDFPTGLKELSRHLPIHFEYKNISFDDIGMNTILKCQKKWQYQTLWFIMSDFSYVITPAEYGPKCAMFKCQEPLKVFSLQTCIDYPRYTSNILKSKADNAVHFVKEFASSLTEHLEENSAVFLAPVSPSYVMWEDPSSLHSHEYLHKIVKTAPDIPVVIGQKEDWEEFCIHLKNKWIAMLKSSMSGHIEPMKVLNMYLKSESKILEFVSPVPRARVSFTQDAWNEVIRGFLMYFANAKMEDWDAEESLCQNDSDSASEELSAVSVISQEQLNKDIVVLQPQDMQVGKSSTEDPSDTLHKLSVSSVKQQTQFSPKQTEDHPATQLAFSPIKWPGGPYGECAAEPVAKPLNEPSATLPTGLHVRLQTEPPVKLSAKSNKQQLEPNKLPVDPHAKQPSVQLIKEETNLLTKLPTESCGNQPTKLPVEPHAKQPGVHVIKQETEFLTKLPTGSLVKQSTEVPPAKLQREASAKLKIEPSSNLPAEPAKLSVNPSNKVLGLINNRGKTIEHMCTKSKCSGTDSNRNGNSVGNSEKEVKDNYDSSSCEKDRVDKPNSESRLIERTESGCDSFRAVSLKMFSSEKGNSHQENLRRKVQRCDSLKLDGRNEDICTVFGEQDHHPKKYFLVRASNIDMLPLSVIHEVFLACGAVGNGKFDGEDLLFAFQSVKSASLCVAKLNNIQILDRFLKVKLEDVSYGNAVEKHADGIPERPKNYSQSSEGSKRKKSHHSHNSHRKQNSLPSALPTSERQPASKRKSNKQRRSSSSSIDSSSANSSFSSLFLEKSPKQRRSSSPDSSSSGFSTSSSAERICHNFDRETKKLFLIEEQRLKMEHQVDYQTYSEIPEVHPRHEERYRAFRAKYHDIYADEDMQECKRLWLSVWEELMNEEHKEEWESKRARLVQQFEAIAAKKKQGDIAKRKKRKREKYEDGKHNYVVSAGPTSGGSWESTEEIIRSQKATCTGKREPVSDLTVGNFLFSQGSSEFEEKQMDDIKVSKALATNLPTDKNQSYLQGRVYASLLTSKNVPVIGDYLPVASTSQHKDDANYVPSDKMPSVRESLSHTLALLLELCESLGVLGPAIKIIVQKVLNCGTNTQSALQVLADDDNALLMKMASEKLISLSEKARGNYKDMLLKGSIQAAKLLEYAAASSRIEKKTYSGIDVEKVAKATMNQDASCIVKFIKNALAYEGVGNPTFEDINEIFLAVSSRHFHMALQS